jgi:hypothetical protein
LAATRTEFSDTCALAAVAIRSVVKRIRFIRALFIIDLKSSR